MRHQTQANVLDKQFLVQKFPFSRIWLLNTAIIERMFRDWTWCDGSVMARPCRPETLLENAKKGNKKKCTKRKSWDSRLGVEDTRTYSSRERKIYHTWRVRLANVISQNAHTFSLVSLSNNFSTLLFRLIRNLIWLPVVSLSRKQGIDTKREETSVWSNRLCYAKSFVWSKRLCYAKSFVQIEWSLLVSFVFHLTLFRRYIEPVLTFYFILDSSKL